MLAYGYWAWAVHTGDIRFAWALGAMLLAWFVWDFFGVPGDSSTRPAIAIPGWARLILEAGYFTGAGTALVAAGAPGLGIAFLFLVAAHSSLTHRRLLWRLHEGESPADG